LTTAAQDLAKAIASIAVPVTMLMTYVVNFTLAARHMTVTRRLAASVTAVAWKRERFATDQ
jgi:mannose/fructose/N-acetylgalactosamine-specific phosphotransferase system component IIC